MLEEQEPPRTVEAPHHNHPAHPPPGLAPADLIKEGSHFDLPIALGLLVAIGAIPSDSVDGMMRILENHTIEDSGIFVQYDGKKVKW